MGFPTKGAYCTHPSSLHLDQWLRLPVPLRPRLRIARRRAVGDVLPCPGQAASWGAADAEVGRPGREGDGLLALADGRLDALDVADDARRVAGLDGHDLYRVLAALGGAPLRLHLVEPRWIGILGEERAVDAGEDGHGGILARRSRGAGEGLGQRAREVDDGGEAGHSKLLTRRERMEPFTCRLVLDSKCFPRTAIEE